MQYDDTAFDLGNQFNCVSKEAVANSLAKINRFTGHTVAPYSVARHCINVSQLCMLMEGAVAAMFGLVHDVHETVINDIATPVKEWLGPHARAELYSLEEQVDRCLYKNLGVPYPVPEVYKKIVKKADLICMAAEHKVLQKPEPRSWDLPYEAVSHEVLAIVPTHSWKDDRTDWLCAFERLQNYIKWDEEGFPNHGKS